MNHRTKFFMLVAVLLSSCSAKTGSEKSTPPKSDSQLASSSPKSGKPSGTSRKTISTPQEKLLQPPSKRGVTQRRFSSPDQALDAYVEALFVHSEEALSQCVNDVVWKSIDAERQIQKSRYSRSWTNWPRLLFRKAWRPEKHSRYAAQVDGDKATILNLFKDERENDGFVKFEFQQSGNEWTLTNRKTGNPADLPKERPPVSAQQIAEDKAFTELARQEAVSSTFEGYYVQLSGKHLVKQGGIRPEILRQIGNLRFVTTIKVSGYDPDNETGLSDDGILKLLPLVKGVTDLEFEHFKCQESTLQKLKVLKRLNKLVLAAKNTTVSDFPLDGLLDLTTLELRGFRCSRLDALSSLKTLTKLSTLRLASIKGLKSKSFEALRSLQRLTEIELSDVEGFDDDALVNLNEAVSLNRVSLFQMKGVNGSGFSKLTKPERITLAIGDQTLEAMHFKNWPDALVSSLTFSDCVIAGKGLASLGDWKRLSNIYIFKGCKFNAAELPALAKLKQSPVAEYLEMVLAVPADDVMYVKDLSFVKSLSITGVATDETLKQLSSMSHLRLLSLEKKAKVSDAAIKSLKGFLPQLKVEIALF